MQSGEACQRIGAGERVRIEDPAAARRLSQYGDSDLALAVSDRRLLIRNTTLTQLRDGLAAMLREVDRDLSTQRALL